MKTKPRFSLAVALGGYRGIKPGVALTVAVVALLVALVAGAAHLVMLQRTGTLISEGQQVVQMLHSYNGALDVWRRMASIPDSDPRAGQLREVRDNRGRILRGDLQELRGYLRNAEDRELVDVALSDLLRPESDTAIDRAELGERGTTAINKLIAGRDAALFEVFERNQRSQRLASLVIALTLVAALLLIAPLSWLYLLHKRGIPPGL